MKVLSISQRPGLCLLNVLTSIRAPRTAQEWSAYYDLRWRVLRAPWHQPPGSEKDEFEQDAIHRMIINDKQQVIAIGRLQQLADSIAQIRYMAVENDSKGQGFGSQILASLEEAAKASHNKSIQLHARETATGFYQKYGYTLIEASHTLYGQIKHFLMEKSLDIEKNITNNHS